MLGDIKGFCKIASMENVFIGFNRESDEQVYNDIWLKSLEAMWIPIIDIAVDNSGFLCAEPQGRALLDVKNINVSSWFECSIKGDIILPPHLNELQQMTEHAKRISRKGGYGPIIRNMVILNSLRSGKFNDDFLFQKI